MNMLINVGFLIGIERPKLLPIKTISISIRFQSNKLDLDYLNGKIVGEFFVSTLLEVNLTLEVLNILTRDNWLATGRMLPLPNLNSNCSDPDNTFEFTKM